MTRTFASGLPFSERNLIITGYIGPDQPVLGRQIAAQLRMPFVNIDAEIAARLDLPIDQIRAYYGETRLKTIEAEIVQEAALRRSSVIRASGRTLINGDNLARLRSTGPVFALRVVVDAMLHRLHVSMGARFHDPNERALAVGELKREWVIYEAPGIQLLDTTDMTTDEIIRTLVGLWRSLTVRRA
ncbi:MAG: shikimate kinase [Chloroflexota bacterium]